MLRTKVFAKDGKYRIAVITKSLAGDAKSLGSFTVIDEANIVNC